MSSDSSLWWTRSCSASHTRGQEIRAWVCSSILTVTAHWHHGTAARWYCLSFGRGTFLPEPRQVTENSVSARTKTSLSLKSFEKLRRLIRSELKRFKPKGTIQSPIKMEMAFEDAVDINSLQGLGQMSGVKQSSFFAKEKINWGGGWAEGGGAVANFLLFINS